MQRLQLFFVTVFAFAYVMTVFVDLMSDGGVENPLMVAAAYGPGIVIAMMARPLIMELATGKLFGQVPTKWETEAMRWIGPVIVNSPHAVFFTWAAKILGKTDTFPDLFWLGGSLAGFILFSHVRSKLKLRQPVKEGTFPYAIDISRQDRAYQDALAAFQRSKPLEALKLLRSSYDINLVQAVHTLRKIRFEHQVHSSSNGDGSNSSSG
ncbi:hypothetical protein QM565_07835 [Geitlerinema splendidum]|nr:hypothetical protein [Geitlerinema splendidum]